MPKYSVSLYETIRHDIEVEAADIDEAHEAALSILSNQGSQDFTTESVSIGDTAHIVEVGEE